MWSRAILKSNAKVALRGRYWQTFLVTLIAAVLAGGFSVLSPGFWHGFWYFREGARAWGAASLSGRRPGFGPAGLLYGIFVLAPILIGAARYFVRNHFEAARLETLFSGFRWNYLNGVGAMFVTNLFIGLWTLLLIIPGIVKRLEYSMVPFLLSDNPDLPGFRAREISSRMTRGQKGSILIFWLSFLGWFFLGAFCAGVGVLFVLPYFSASQAELYLFLRTRALENGDVSAAELGLVRPGFGPRPL